MNQSLNDRDRRQGCLLQFSFFFDDRALNLAIPYFLRIYGYAKLFFQLSKVTHFPFIADYNIYTCFSSTCCSSASVDKEIFILREVHLNYMRDFGNIQAPGSKVTGNQDFFFAASAHWTFL